MRISVVSQAGPEFSSVYRHSSSRFRFWESKGNTVRFHIVGSGRRRLHGPVKNLIDDMSCLPRLHRELSQSSPDLIVLRWGVPVPLLGRCLESIAPVVLDIHASEMAEMGTSRIRSLYLRSFRNGAFRASRGSCFVTAELAGHPDFVNAPNPRAVFPNGSSLHVRDLIGIVPNRIGIAVGNGMPHQGLDKFVRLANSLSGCSFRVAVNADAANEVLSLVAGSAATLVETTSESEYVEELSTWAVAIGTLALERSAHRSATPLKVRDYLGLGIPTILPYFDPEVCRLRDPLVVQLSDAPGQYGELSASRLERFALEASGQNIDLETSLSVSLARIEMRRLAFFHRVLQGGC